MHRTTIMLPRKLKDRAEARAREMGISLADLIRKALGEVLKTNGKNKPDPLFADQAVYEGPCEADLSARVDHYLYGERE